MKKYLLVFVIFLMLLSISCGGSSSGFGNTQTVSFDMSNSNGWVTCNNRNEQFNTIGSLCNTEQCYWHCGSGYKNANGNYVIISFSNCGKGWSISDDYIGSSGSCH